MAEAKWYVIHTYSGYENKVAGNLEKLVENQKMHDLIHEIKVPTETVVEIKPDGSKKETERKVFPSYVMVKMVMTDDSWYVVRNIQGCTGFVGPASKPVPLSDKEVEAMGIELKSVNAGYSVGDNVKIIDGPLANYEGKVDELDVNENRVKITISVFGRETAVELEIDQVQPVE